MRNLGLDLSDGDLEEYKERCFSILEWADENGGSFDSYFVESLLKQIIEKKFISENQKAAIDNIITGFDIE